jgi:hypothetical protein
VTAHSLIQPALHDYPFISIIFRGEATGFKTDEGIEQAGDTKWQAEMLVSTFGSPGKIDLHLIAPYEAMSDETFAALSSILGFRCGNVEIRDRASLERFAQQDINQLLPIDPCFETYSPAQLETYSLARATLSRTNIHWGNLVSLYNQSTHDQQQAISQYFEKYHGLELERLLAYKAKKYQIPAGLDEPAETKTLNGNTHLYSEVLQMWLREDRYHQQYRVDIVTDVYRTLVATAPTLAQALAKAIGHLKETPFSLDFEHLEILQGGLKVATATFESRADDRLLNDFALRLVRPAWRLDELGAEKEIAEKKMALYLTDQMVEAMTKYTKPIKKNDFIKTLYRVEKAMGVQWSKVKHLEDALGL